MFTSSNKTAWLAAAVVVALAGGAGGVYWWRLPRDEKVREPEPAPAAQAKDFPLPVFSKSRYLNTGADVRHIGSAACAVCHSSKHQSYIHTAHSKALSDVDERAEPPDGEFTHKPSGRHYRVYRKDGQMRHEESVRGRDGAVIARIDLPVRYLVGSGNFSRTYLVEVDGFLHESPITYYSSTKRWWLSPGYDTPTGEHFGFERPVTTSCMFCHAGQVEQDSRSVHRLSFPEKAIGCENCHGPGSLHQQRHQGKKFSVEAEIGAEDDWTIVNPRKLSRALQEDVCANCHLHGQASIPLRGRQHTDYRPGMPLADFRSHYDFESGNERMSVVGHVEQMRQSACYKKSDMTCMSCHESHRTAAGKTVMNYRKKCLSCHAATKVAECSLDMPARQKKNDQCADCHMPRGDTDIIHIAFTHHRVGKHPQGKPKEKNAAARTPDLTPMEEVANLAAIDRDRNLGVAYMEAALGPGNAAIADAYRDKGKALLERVYAAGLRDGKAMQLLMEACSNKEPARASVLAREILEQKDAPLNSRASALFQLASYDISMRNHASAQARLLELNKIYRNAEHMRMLGVSYFYLNQSTAAVPTLQEALSIRPYSADIHEDLAEALRRTGDGRAAQDHLHKAKLLRQHGGAK